MIGEMTSERLAHWHWVIAKHHEPLSMSSVVIDVRDLAAFVDEVERLRARDEALTEALRVAMSTVECDSLDERGRELPWHVLARRALAEKA